MKTPLFLKLSVLSTLLFLISFPFGIIAQDLLINEFMASNVALAPEIVDYDDYSDWIEIYNNTLETINLSGYGITDDLEDPEKWKFPNGSVIPAKGYLLLWADGYNDYPRPGIKYYHLN